jgi:iron complex outermembrane receptor protein
MRLEAIAAAALLLAAGPARATEREASPARAAPSEYEREIEDEGQTGGLESEVDAGAAQAEREGAGEAVPGVARKRLEAVEEIVVQARKRSELLEDTPISITAIDEQTLSEATVTRLDDIAQLVPNLVFDFARDPNGAIPRIRGIGPIEAGDPGVGVYVDGVYLPRSLTSVLNAVDIQQIEVLRGPQGTLFGKNTIGGAINITTVKPREDLEAYALVRPGNYDLVETRATLNVPVRIGALEDRLFSRFSFASANQSGYAFNEFRDETVGDRSALWFLGALRFVPTDDVEVNFSGNWFKDHSNGRAGECVRVSEPPDPVTASIVNSLHPDFPANCAATSPRITSGEVGQIFSVEDYGTWGNVIWDVGSVGFLDSLQLKAIGSWREQENRYREDGDQTQDPLIVLNTMGGQGFEFGAPNRSRQFLAEGQINGAALEGDLVFVSGVFAQWEKQSRTDAIIAISPTLFQQAGVVDQDQEDWALFGQATYDPLEWLSLTAGVRYSEESRSVSRDTFDLTRDPAVEIQTGEGDKTFSSWTPMVSIAAPVPEELLESTPVESLLPYFTYSNGFTSGGFNATIASGGMGDQPLLPFEPATLDNFEIGLKTSGFEQRVTFNAAFFLGEYDDQQVTTLIVVPNPDPDGLPISERIIANAAKSTIKGFELELFTRPFEGLFVDGSIGLTDARYDDFLSVSALTGDTMNPINRAGETFNAVPKFKSFVSIQYSFPVELGDESWLDGWLTPRLEWYYQSSVHYAFPEVLPLKQSGYNTLNARLSYDFWDDRAQVALWGKNLTDETVIGGGVPLIETLGFVTRYYLPPVTFGAELSVRF